MSNFLFTFPKKRGWVNLDKMGWVLFFLWGSPFFVWGQQLLFDYVKDHVAIMLLIDPDTGKIENANEAAVRFYGYPREKLLSMKIDEINILNPAEIAEERKRAVQEERNYFVFPHRLASGEIRTVEVYSSPVYSPVKQKKLLLSIVHDATGKMLAREDSLLYQERLTALVRQKTEEILLVRSRNQRLFILLLVVAVLVFIFFVVYFVKEQREGERKLLYRELQHRLKNSFATLSSFVALQIAEAENPLVETSLRELQSRIETIGSLYDLLYQHQGGKTIELVSYLRLVCDALNTTYHLSSRAIHFMGPEEPLWGNPKDLSTVGLIMNELVINALKHGDPTSSIEVSLSTKQEEILLSVSNKTMGKKEGEEESETRGLGRYLIQQMVDQLKGSLSIVEEHGTTRAVVLIPLKGVVYGKGNKASSR
ncbi:MAG: PAS domain S-box protein [Treponemataceae bacterium]|nr:PAS domain S-box protein [Treponemataceae bacterium]